MLLKATAKWQGIQRGQHAPALFLLFLAVFAHQNPNGPALGCFWQGHAPEAALHRNLGSKGG